MMEDHSHEESGLRSKIAFMAVVGLLLLLNVLGWFRTLWGVNTAILLTLIGGYKIFFEALRGLLGRKISADLAVAIAAIAALCIEQYAAAAEVIFIMLIGECLESFAVDRTRGAIAKLLALSPEQARVRRDGAEVVVPIEEVRPGDTVIVLPGERVPVDGVVRGGRSSIDQSAMTGESMPTPAEPGTRVLTATVNGLGALEIVAEAVGPDTKLAEIIHLVEEAEESKAPTQRRVDRYARFFVPVVIAISVATFFVSRWLGQPLEGAIVRAVSVLIVACPCALVLATPTAIAAALGRLAGAGILIKGGAFLEALGEADCVVFDKTGTLTRGEPRIARIETLGGADEDAALAVAAAVERQSEHVLGQLIVAEARERGLDIAPTVEDFKPLPGFGVEAVVDGEDVLVGGRKLLRQNDVAVSLEDEAAIEQLDQRGYTTVLVARAGRLICAIGVEDTMRDEAPAAVAGLREAGIERILMLTGDNERAAALVARQAGIREVEAGLLPAEKAAVIRRLQSEGRRVAMLGDGINDAPSLAVADVGVAMGGIGSDIAMEAADVVIMTDDPARLGEAVQVGRRMLSTINANILYFALGFNALGVAGASSGLVSPVGAAVLHQISSLLVCLNSLRLLIAGRFNQTWLGRGVERFRVFLAEDIPNLAAWAWRRRGAVASTALGILAVLHVAGGFYRVQPGEIGVERRFGEVVQRAEPGLRYCWPWPVGALDRMAVERVQSLEIGFRTAAASTAPTTGEPAAYEWNTRHTIGRYEKNIEEAVMLTGDENLVEATLVVHYVVNDPVKHRLGLSDAEKLLRLSAESAARSVISERPQVDALAADRRAIEEEAAERLRGIAEQYQCGVEIKAVYLQDIHPPLEVVEDFRAVSSAFEEKHRLVNEAQGYAAETKELAKGQAMERREAAQAYRTEKENRARGDAGRFEVVAAARALAGEVASVRLFLETVEAALAPVRKVIIDQRRNGGTRLFLFDGQGLPSMLGEAFQPALSGSSPATPIEEYE
jgi:Cu+-exporting ATPase